MENGTVVPAKVLPAGSLSPGSGRRRGGDGIWQKQALDRATVLSASSGLLPGQLG